MYKEPRQVFVYVWIGVSTYIIVKYLFPEKPEFRSKSNPNPDIRGGDLSAPQRFLVVRRVTKFLLKGKAAKTAVLSIFLVMINEELITGLAQILAESSPALIADTTKKLQLKFSPVTKQLLASEGLEEAKLALIKTELGEMSKPFLVKLKYLLLKAKIKYLLKHLTGKNKRQLIFMLIALLAYLFTNNTPLFAFLAAMIREILKETPEDLNAYLTLPSF